MVAIVGVLDCFAGLCRDCGLHPLVGFAGLVIVVSYVTVVRNPRTYYA